MPDALPTDPLELEALAEKVREFLRISRPIPIVVVEKREPTSGKAWEVTRHKTALAQIESCYLVQGAALGHAEALARFGVSCLTFVELDHDLVIPVDPSDVLPSNFGGPRSLLRPLPPGGVHVTSADSSWPWGHLASVAKVNLEACREDAEALARRLEPQAGSEQREHEEPKAEKEPRRAKKKPKPSSSAQEDRREVLTAIRDGCMNWAAVAKKIGRNASTVRKIGALLISEGLVEKDGSTRKASMRLTAKGHRAVERAR